MRRGDRYYFAHPTSPRAGEDWYRPAHHRARYALLVAGQTAVILGVILAILAAGAVAGAVVGFPMDPVR